ncbi:MAG: hypothetical protein M1820_001742 [Bogoriella megaspora]|nr:MAG: hypothetical protein M1820_001742 [Bogoriella megaspora]
MSNPTIEEQPSRAEPVHNQSPSETTAARKPNNVITIRYKNPNGDTQPPVYVATSLTSPPWEPAVMEPISNGTHLEYYKDFADVEPGEYQYKFRLGPGDMWVLDETAPTVYDEHGNENSMLAVRTDALDLGKHMEESDAPVDRVDSASPVQSPNVPAVVVDKVDNSPVHGDDLGPHATEGQKRANEIRSEDAEPDEIRINPRASEDMGDDGISPLTVPTDVKPLDFSAIRQDMAFHNPAFAEAVGHEQIDDSPREEHVPLFAHEACVETPSDIPSVPLYTPSTGDPFSSLADENPGFADAVGYDPQLDNDSPLEGPPLFAHECASSEDEAPEEHPRRRPNTGARQGSALKNVETHEDEDDDEETLSRDPSVQKFPNTRQDIMMQLGRTSSRLGQDNNDCGGTPPSPIRSRSSPTNSNPDVSNGQNSSLNNIVEDPEAEEEEAQQAVKEGDRRRSDNGLSQKQDFVDGLKETTMKPLPLIQQQENSTETQVTHTDFSSARSPPTPPLTPEEADKSTSKDFAEQSAPTEDAPKPSDSVANIEIANNDDDDSKLGLATPVVNGALRQRRPDADARTEEQEEQANNVTEPTSHDIRSPASSSSLAQKTSREGWLQAFWRVAFGSWLAPLGNLLGRLCGGRRNAA